MVTRIRSPRYIYCKKDKPKVTVEHQYSTIAAPWIFGVTERLADYCDYVGGDFYGGVLEQSFACKLYYNLTPQRPFEYMTSICYPNLTDHTTVKPEELIEAQASMTLAHQGAFLIIDAIDPIGTLDERRYEMIGRVYEKLRNVAIIAHVDHGIVELNSVVLLLEHAAELAGDGVGHLF